MLHATRARRLRHEWRPCADKQLNPKEGRILIKGLSLRVEKKYMVLRR